MEQKITKKDPKKDPNPNTKASPLKAENMPSWDSRHNHGLSEDETLKAKK